MTASRRAASVMSGAGLCQHSFRNVFNAYKEGDAEALAWAALLRVLMAQKPLFR
ncbi:MAG: hypothetical protein MZV63_50305 [Marinilabiliales bacterium]|nr:hypothetical protein [Marinilabiliales bacterium]